MSEYQLPLRSEVPIEKTWDLTPIFKDTATWEAEFEAVIKLISQAEAYKGTLGNGSQPLLSALEYRDELFQRLGKLYVYTHLNEDSDTTNPTYQSLQARSVSLITQGHAAFSFFNSEIMAIAEEKLTAFFEENNSLKQYTQEFDELLKSRAYILSDKEEALLAKASETINTSKKTFAMLNNADLEFPTIQDENGNDVPLSHGLFRKMLENKSETVRHDAYVAVYNTYGKFKNTLASTLGGTVKGHSLNAELRGFTSARHAALFNNSIPETVYDALVEAVNDKLPALHKYIELRKKALQLDKLHMYDVHVSIVNDVDMTFTFEEAKDLVIEGLAALGEEYQAVLRKAFDERWIDQVENKGKRSGAYSSGTYGTSPYILMNWQGTLDNVFTLAHELGHSVHSYYTRSNQPFIYGDYSIFLAEIASTTNENLLTEYMLKKYTDPKVRAYIINHYLDGVKGTVYRQTQFAEFEQLIHKADAEGTPLTAEFLNQQYGEINQKYYGKAIAYDDYISREWSRVPHFYYNFYVYQYATGFSAASAFSGKILAEGKPALDKYINFLKAGCSDYPIEVLKKAGLDMTTNKPVLDALDIFAKRLEELEKLI